MNTSISQRVPRFHIVGTSRASLPDLLDGGQRHEEINVTPPSLIIFSVSLWRRWLAKCLAK
jgi:hypothetical protein